MEFMNIQQYVIMSGHLKLLSTVMHSVQLCSVIHCSNACNLKPNVQALTITDIHYLTSSKKWVRQLLYSLITASIYVYYLTKFVL